MSRLKHPTTVRVIALTVLACVGAAIAGCSLGGGSSRSGGPPSDARAPNRTVTLRFASAAPDAIAVVFINELARRSGGRLRAVKVSYDDLATDVDQRIARDLRGGRLDVANVAARAWESFGVTGFRAFQAPFLITSDALLDRVTADPRITQPLLRSLGSLGTTGLALSPRGLRYLFATDRRLDRPDAFDAVRIRVNASLLTEDILSALRARPTAAVRSGADVIAALRNGSLDAIEADMPLAAAAGYVQLAPHVSPALFAKVTTLVANSKRLHELGPSAARWIRAAATRAAAVARSQDDRSAWAAGCSAGLMATKITPAQLDALQAALLRVHGSLDGDPAAAAAIDRIALLATQTPRTDPWAHCGTAAQVTSPTRVIDGTYEVTITQADLDRTGTEPGNDGDYRFHIANGRYAALQVSNPQDPAWPGWDFSRDPVEVGSVLVHNDRAMFRPETSIAVGAKPSVYHFELFRDRLRWRFVSGDEYVVFNARPWRRMR